MKKVIIFSLIFINALYSDVVNEYRDYSKKAYIATTHLFQSTSESEQKAYETYGEYSINDYVSFTARVTTGHIINKDENSKDKVHIISSGLRFHWLLADNLRVGFKTNLVDRDYNEVDGLSYRFMPVIEYDPFSFLNLRYIFEYDYIPSSSFKESKSSQTHKETALYLRLMPWKYFNKDGGLEYEVKMASGVGNDREDGSSLWKVSYEHNAYWNITDDLKLKYSRVREGSKWGHQTAGLVYQYSF